MTRTHKVMSGYCDTPKYIKKRTQKYKRKYEKEYIHKYLNNFETYLPYMPDEKSKNMYSVYNCVFKRKIYSEINALLLETKKYDIVKTIINNNINAYRFPKFNICGDNIIINLYWCNHDNIEFHLDKKNKNKNLFKNHIININKLFHK